MHYTKPTLDTLPRTIVLANGDFPTHPLSLSLIDAWVSGQEGWRLICCDGAINKLLSYTDRLPDMLIGDLDSVSDEIRLLLGGERLIRVEEQDSNDLTKAMRYVHSTYGRVPVVILGASGAREDHMLANIFLMPSYGALTSELVMLTDRGCFRLVTEPSTIEVELGTQISIFAPHGGPISLRGVHWPLEEAILPELWCGTLNRADEPIIDVDVKAPTLIYLAFGEKK